MRNFRKTVAMLMVMTITGVALTSCSKDDNNENPTPVEQEKNTNVKEVEIKTSAMGNQMDPAEQTGDFVKFSFKEGKVVTSDDWDFAIRGRLFITNGRKTPIGQQPNVFGEKEPNRTKNVEVTTIVGEFEDIKNIGGFVSTDWHKDYDYASGSFDPTAPAISYSSNTRSTSNSRESWHLRSGKDANKLILRPVVFIFKTQDGSLAKMKITKIERTNTDFDTKEDVDYMIQYYYNPNPNSPSLDETK